MSFQKGGTKKLPKGIVVLDNVSDVDPRKSVIFTSKQAALDALDNDDTFGRVEGLKLKIRQDNKIVEYMFDGGIANSNFIPFSVVSNSNSFTFEVDKVEYNKILEKVNNVTEFSIDTPSDTILKFIEVNIGEEIKLITKVFNLITKPKNSNNILKSGQFGFEQQEIKKENLQLVDERLSTPDDILELNKSVLLDFKDLGSTNIVNHVSNLAEKIVIKDKNEKYTIFRAVVDNDLVEALYIGSLETYGSGFSKLNENDLYYFKKYENSFFRKNDNDSNLIEPKSGRKIDFKHIANFSGTTKIPSVNFDFHLTDNSKLPNTYKGIIVYSKESKKHYTLKEGNRAIFDNWINLEGEKYINESRILTIKVPDLTKEKAALGLNSYTPAPLIKDVTNFYLKTIAGDLVRTYALISNPINVENLVPGRYGAGYKTIQAEHLLLLKPEEQLSSGDVEQQANEIKDLGSIDPNDIVYHINNLGYKFSLNDFTLSTTLIKTVQNNKQVDYIYQGSGGDYGLNQTNTITISDLQLIEQEKDQIKLFFEKGSAENLIRPRNNKKIDFSHIANTPNFLLPADITNKVDKVTGKGLSQENFTTVLKSKLQALESSKFLGQYTSLTNLNNNHSNPVVGSYAYVDGGPGNDVIKYAWDNNDNKFVKQLGESNEETPSSILTKLLQNADTENFTTAYKTALDNLSNDLAGKLNTGGYNGSAQDLKNLIDNLSTYTSTDFTADFNNKTTDDLTEGITNKYNLNPNWIETDPTSGKFIESKPRIKDKEVIIQEKSQLLSGLQEGFIYVIDGDFTLSSGEYITLPSQNIALSGYGFDVSAVKKFVAGESIFKSATGGSKNLVLKDILFMSGSGKVFDISDVDGSHAIEINDVNLINCADLGEIDGYRQFTAATMGIYSCSNGLKLSGAWNGFKIANSNCFGFDSGGTLFRQGTNLTFSNRFFIDMALDLPVGAKLLDFDAGNFLNDELLQINSTILKVDGVIDYNVAEDVIPNITANNPKCLWRSNVGLPDTSLEKFINNDNVAGFYDISWLVDTYFITMTGDTTFTESDLPANLKNTQEITIYLQGDFEPTFPSDWYNNAVGTYKKGEVNQITLKFIKSGIYFMKIDNSLTIYPAPIITKIAPTNFIPNENKIITIEGNFLTPATIVEVKDNTVNNVNFISSSKIEVNLFSSSNSGDFDLSISNGTKVVYPELIGVYLGNVYPLKSNNYISKSNFVNVTDLSEMILFDKNNQQGTVYFKDINGNIPFQIRLQFRINVYTKDTDSKNPAHSKNYDVRLTDKSNGDIVYSYQMGYQGYSEAWLYYYGSRINSTYTGVGYKRFFQNNPPGTVSPIRIIEHKNGYLKLKDSDGNIKSQYLLPNALPSNLKLEFQTKHVDLVNLKHIELPTA